MTSPAISKSPEKKKEKSPSHSSNAEAAPANEEPTATTSDAPPSDPFSWLRIFKLADLMMKQGC